MGRAGDEVQCTCSLAWGRGAGRSLCVHWLVLVCTGLEMGPGTLASLNDVLPARATWPGLSQAFCVLIPVGLYSAPILNQIYFSYYSRISAMDSE